MYIEISENTVAKRIKISLNILKTIGNERQIYETNIYDTYFHDILY